MTQILEFRAGCATGFDPIPPQTFAIRRGEWNTAPA